MNNRSYYGMTNTGDSNTDYRELRRLLLQARDEIDEVLAAIASSECNRDNNFLLYLELERIRARVTEAANEVLPEEPNLDEDGDTYPICDSCGYYAESPYLVCALHPTGPVETDCPDYEDAVGEAVQFPLAILRTVF